MTFRTEGQSQRAWNWALIDQALVSGTNFAVGIILARYLGVREYGAFVLLWMAVQFSSGVQYALVGSPMLSIAPKFSEELRPAYFSATARLQVGLSSVIPAIAVASLLLPGWAWPRWIERDSMLPLALCAYFVQVQDYLRRSCFTRMQPQRGFWIDLVGYGAQPLLILPFAKAYPSAETALLVIAATMTASILVARSSFDLTSASWAQTVEVAARHWRSSKWLLGSTLLSWVSGNYFLIVAAALLGPAVVGAIRAAQNLFGLTHILFQGLDNVVPAEASSRLHEKGASALVSYLRNVALVLVLGTGTLALLATKFANSMLQMVYGSAHPESVTAIIWFVPVYVFAAMAVPIRAGLRALEDTRAIFLANVTATGVSLTLAKYLVGTYETDGTMLGMCVVQAIITITLMYGMRIAIRKAL